MRIEQIEQLIEIVKCGSIGKAAQKLYVQQPNLSTMLKSIEDEFHQPLFYRTPNGVRLTPFGKDFMAFAEPYYKQYKLLKEIGENGSGSPVEEFNVCSHHMTIARWVFSELCTVYSDRPLRMRMANVSFEDIPQSVASHQFDIGILGLVKNQSRLHLKIFSSLGLEFIHLGNAPFSAIVADCHPFIRDHIRSVSLDMCKMYPFVLYRPMEVYLRALESYQRLINHRTLIDVPDYVLAQDIMRQGKAFSVGPLKYLYNSRYQSQGATLVELPFEDRSAELCFGYVKRRNETLSEIGQEYVSLLASMFAHP